MLDYGLLERLCRADAPSGFEDEVREIILSEIKDYADKITVDNMGNVLVFKKGKATPKKKLLLSAHMDEVGFIVTDIKSDGTLKFAEVGGINDTAVFAKQVKVGKNKISGVINAKPTHLLSADERKKVPSKDTLCIDIGAKDKEDAEKYVSLGDMVVFDSPYENKNGRIISKAIDDRFGCLVLIEMIKSELPYDMYFSFVVQEEIGLRGAKAAAYTINPDCAIVIEATTAADVPFAEDEKRVCLVGGGAVVSFMDRSTMYDKEFYQIARSANAKTQTKTMIAGGNDAGAIHCSRGGVRTIAVSVPCRYIHSSSSLASVDDMESVFEVVKYTAEKILSNVE